MRVFIGVPERASGPRVLTIGNFDGMHLGHHAMIAQVRARADALGMPAAVLTFEPHPRELFAPADAPARLTSLREKLALLEASGVDEVYLLRFSRQAAAIGAHTLWLQIGVVSPEAVAVARSGGLEVVMDRCVKIEHARLFGGLNWFGVNTKLISSKRPNWLPY